MATTSASEQALIAAFLYNFLKFTEWPEEIVIRELKLCIPENQKFKELDEIAGRSIQNRPVIIKLINIEEQTIDDCQLLFLSKESSTETTLNWLKVARQKPILIVSNMNEFLDMGGMIILINSGKTLSFEIHLERVKNSGLKLNAQLLQIARHVRGR